MVQNACFQIIPLQDRGQRAALKTTNSLSHVAHLWEEWPFGPQEGKSLEQREVDCLLESQQELTGKLRYLKGYSSPPHLSAIPPSPSLPVSSRYSDLTPPKGSQCLKSLSIFCC